jgi:hypothetical protein
MLRFSIPLMCSGLLQILFNTADIIVVGRFAGDNSLAAVGSTASLIHLLVNLFMGLSTGASILAARHFGAKEDEEVHKTVHTASLENICIFKLSYKLKKDNTACIIFAESITLNILIKRKCKIENGREAVMSLASYACNMICNV